jgi:hypothetical protein
MAFPSALSSCRVVHLVRSHFPIGCFEVRKETVMKLLSGIVAIEGYLQFERVVSLKNKFFPFPVATAL